MLRQLLIMVDSSASALSDTLSSLLPFQYLILDSMPLFERGSIYNLIEHDGVSLHPFLLWHVVLESAIGSGEQTQACHLAWVSHLPSSESFPFLLMAWEGGCWLHKTIPFFVLVALKCGFFCFGPKQVQ